MGSLVTTTRVRLPAGPHEAELDRAADLFGRLERLLHVRLRDLDRGRDRPGGPEDANALKRAFIVEHGITARHYNSLLRALEGKHASVVEKAKLDAVDREERLAAVLKKIADAEKKLAAHDAAGAGIAARSAKGKPPTKAQAKSLLSERDHKAIRRGLHGRKRKATRLRARIEGLHRIADMRVPPLVFGTRKLLRSQPKDPNSQEFAAWRARWREARSAQIFSVGSKDEPGGSQCCRPIWDDWEDGSIGLRLRRLGPTPEGCDKFIEIRGIPLNPHAVKLLKPVRALFAAEGSIAVSVRLVRSPPDAVVPEGMSRWDALITVEEETPEARFVPGRRVLGVDVNADHLAWALLTPDGNRLRTGRINLALDGLGSQARRSLICEAASALVKIAIAEDAQIALEDLDFTRKKRELSIRPESALKRSKLHALPYAAILEAIRRRAARRGVPVREVNPAYTSIIGRVNFSTRHGISTHRAAALAIGRRAQGHSERVHYPLGSGDADPPARAEKPRRHVWSQWAKVRREVSRLDAVAWKSARAGGSGTIFPPPPLLFRGRRPASSRPTPPPSTPVNDWIPDFPYVPGQEPTGETVKPLEPDKSGSGRDVVRNDNVF